MRLIFLLIGSIIAFASSFAQICPGAQGSVQWQCWRNLYYFSLEELTAYEFFPQRPEVERTIYKLDAPINFDNYFGARMAGYIKVPVTDTVQFNITCNELGAFYLSTDDSPTNLQRLAYTNAATGISEHDKYPEQTSSKVLLQADQFYYFEILYVDRSWSDHCRLHWKASFLNNNNWNIISNQFIYNISCLPDLCPERGTPCNDNNPNTIDDVEDGHCNCVGKPITENNCVGERSYVERFRYENITGSTLNDLYSAPSFPATPNYSASMPVLGVPYSESINNIGHLVSAYLSVPVSGYYKFNLTGDDQTAFFLSNDHDPANKQSTLAIVLGWTRPTEHDKYVFQTTANVYLEAGRYYYLEINHKEGSGGEHFGVFWQTPFTPVNVWKRLSSFYLYDYACDLACIPEGTPCDDGNPYTNNDQYDNNCTCQGTPCTGPDCDSPLANYVYYEKCGLTEMIDNRESTSWLSCQAADNPNPANPRSHWLMYDLGERYELISSQVWNYNVPGQTDKGFEMVKVDYSEDGSTWNNLGEFNWLLAPGENGYSGFSGPEFNGIRARYVLFTSLDDTLTCRGISKVSFRAVLCPLAGTPCDDNNPVTVDDKYDNNCVCKGLNLSSNPCDEISIILQDTILQSQVVGAEQNVLTLSSVEVDGVAAVVAGNYIELLPGFETKANALFQASIGPCESQNILPSTDKNNFARMNRSLESDELSSLFTKPVEKSDYFDIYFRVSRRSHPQLVLHDLGSNIKYFLVDYEILNKGLYRKRIRSKRISDTGNVSLKLIDNGAEYEVLGLK